VTRQRSRTPLHLQLCNDKPFPAPEWLAHSPLLVRS